ncbi:MAG TPA: arginase [Gemmatimonadaceae bacterium]|nr:arginase [Gemmatimonadaceae bacterium]
MAHVRLIGFPMDLGAARRGVDMGPSAIRIAGAAERIRALGHTVDESTNIDIPLREELPETKEGRPQFLATVTAACTQLAMETAKAVRDGALPVTLGGDHSLAAGSVAGVATALAERGERLGVIWLDAHSDIHTPASSASGNIHGMPVAHLLGHGDPGLSSIATPKPAVRADDVVLVGLRDVDGPERKHIRDWGVKVFTMRDIDERGIAAVMREAIEIASRDTAGIHVSFDADWLDPMEAPGVGTPVTGGATYREAHTAMEMIADSEKLLALDIVEVNPVLDRENRTAALSVGLLASALGLRVI